MFLTHLMLLPCTGICEGVAVPILCQLVLFVVCCIVLVCHLIHYFSHCLNVSTFSLSYSLLICKCRLLILFLIIQQVISHEQDQFLLEETSFCQLSNMASSGLKKLFSQQFLNTHKVCGKMFSLIISNICVWLVLLPYM